MYRSSLENEPVDLEMPLIDTCMSAYEIYTNERYIFIYEQNDDANESVKVICVLLLYTYMQMNDPYIHKSM